MAKTAAKPARKKPAKDESSEPKPGKARKSAKKPKQAVAPFILAGLTDAQRAEVEARAQIVINLTDKIDCLIESEMKLTIAIANEGISEPDRASARLRKREAIAERDLCRTRIPAPRCLRFADNVGPWRNAFGR